MTDPLTLLEGDVLERIREVPDDSVHCVVTSPPYWGLRDYGTGTWAGGDPECEHRDRELRRGVNLANSPVSVRGGAKKIAEVGWLQHRHECPCGAVRFDQQLGLEATPDEYLERMVEVFREVRRVLRPDGTAWVNMGDAYNSATSVPPKESDGGVGGWQRAHKVGRRRVDATTLKPKDLVGMPWRLALALQEDGWWLRSDVIEEVEFYCPCGCGHVMEERVWRYANDRDIIWAKPNPMPESVTDRPTKAHEYVFLLTKRDRYYYDAEAIAEPTVSLDDTHPSFRPNSRRIAENGGRKESSGKHEISARSYNVNGRNARSVWTITTRPYPGAHFATFPVDLPRRCILAGTSEKGCCERCGAPRARVIETSGGTTGKSWSDGTPGRELEEGPSSRTRRLRPGGTASTRAAPSGGRTGARARRRRFRARCSTRSPARAPSARSRSSWAAAPC